MNQKMEFQWSDINPACIIRRLLREVPMLLLGGIIAVMLSIVGMQNFYQPKYTSSAPLAVNVRSGSYTSVLSNLSASSEIAKTFTELFQSNMFGELAKKNLGKNSLPGQLTASVLPETNLLVLKVTADTPQDAYQTLNLMLDNYNGVSGYVFQNVVLRELDAPTLPSAPSNPLNKSGIIKKAFVLGFGATLLAVLAIALLSDTVQSSDSVKHKLDTKLLASIHHEEKNKTLRTMLKRSNKGLLITSPGASFRFREEYSRLATKLTRSLERTGGKVLLVASVRENEGKSTVAANLALSMAKSGKRVLLVDADFHKPAQFKLFHYKPEHNLVSVLTGETQPKADYLEKCGFYAFFTSKAVSGAGRLISSAAMNRLIRAYREQMDVVIIDTPPMQLFSDGEALSDLADCSVLVVRQDITPAKFINDAIDLLSEGTAKMLGCVFNDEYVLRLPGSGTGSYGYGYGYGKYGSYGKYGYGHYESATQTKTEET